MYPPPRPCQVPQPCSFLTPFLSPGFPQRDLSLPLMERKAFAKGREHKHRDSAVGYEARSQVGLGSSCAGKALESHRSWGGAPAGRARCALLSQGGTGVL